MAKKKNQAAPHSGLDGLDEKLARARAKLAGMGAAEKTASTGPSAPADETPLDPGTSAPGPGPDGLDAKPAGAGAELSGMEAGGKSPASEPQTPAEGSPPGSETGTTPAPGLDGLEEKLAKARAKLAAMESAEKSAAPARIEPSAGSPGSEAAAAPVGPDATLAEAQARLEESRKTGGSSEISGTPASPVSGGTQPETESRQAAASRKRTESERPERLLHDGSVRTLRVSADKENLVEVRNFVSRFGPLMGLSSRQTNRLRMCIDEAFTNIFRHAYSTAESGPGKGKARQKHEAVIRMRTSRDTVEVRCIDWGKEFIIDKGKITAPDLKKYVEIEKKGGLGLFMINKFTSYWELKRIKDQNVLLMRFIRDIKAESFMVFLRRNLTWNRMSLRVRFSIILLLIFTLGVMVFYKISLSAQKRSLLAQYKAGALAGMAELSLNAVQFIPADPKRPVDGLGLAVLLQEVRNADPAVLSAGVLRSNMVVARIVSNSVSIIPSAYTIPSPGKIDRGWLTERYADWVSPFVVNLQSRWSAGARYLDWMVMKPMTVETEHGFLIRDFREADILHLTGSSKWGSSVFLTLSKSGFASRMNAFQTRLLFIILLGSFLLGAFLLIYWLGSAFLDPIRDFVYEMRRLSREGLKARLDLKSKSRMFEVSELEGLVNTLIGQASASIAETKGIIAEQQVKLKESEEIVTDANRMKSELLIGQEIQLALLPKEIPEIEGYEIGAAYVAATEMGGDYYDFIKVSPTGLGMVVGDVSGHGIASAMMMSSASKMLKAMRRIESTVYSDSYKEAHRVLGFLNDFMLGEFPKGMYITMFYVFLDAKRREVNYASAGHNPMILYRGDTEQVYNLNPKGFSIGLDLGDPQLFRKALRRETVQLRKGDLLFVYTDGITEAMNEAREEYGERRLIDAIKRFHALPAKEMADALIEDIRTFTGGVPQSDDITFIVLKEKSSLGDIEFNRRLNAILGFEKDEYSENTAARKAGVTPELFRRLVRRRKRSGDAALREDIEEVARPIDRLDIETSAKLLHLVASHPEYSVEELQRGLDTELYGFFKTETLPILRELKRLNLTNLEKRQRFGRREKQLAAKGKKKSVFIRSSAFLSKSAAAAADLPPAPVPVETATEPVPAGNPESGGVPPGPGESSNSPGTGESDRPVDSGVANPPQTPQNGGIIEGKSGPEAGQAVPPVPEEPSTPDSTPAPDRTGGGKDSGPAPKPGEGKKNG